MNKHEQDQLTELLKKFFSEYDLNARDCLCKNKIATLLKKELKKKNRWKSLPRGKSRKLRVSKAKHDT